MAKTIYMHIYAPVDAQSVEDFHATLLEKIKPETETIYISMTTSGGSVAHGFALYNLLRSMPYRIVTHNIANVDSIGVVVFLAGDDRYAEKNATFMIHPVQSTIKSKNMSFSTAKEKINAIEKDMERIKKTILEHAQIGTDELDDLFQVGQVKTADDVLKCGLISGIRPVPFEKQAVVVTSSG